VLEDSPGCNAARSRATPCHRRAGPRRSHRFRAPNGP